MKHLVAIGEALIDFLPQEAGKPIRHTESFLPNVGGAPANVCGAFTKLGGRSAMLTKLGKDPFGDKIIEELSSYGIDTTQILQTEEARTSLAFVALSEDGNREFSFYRKPGADMLYRPEEVPKKIFENAYALHFCSVSLGDFPMKEAHKTAIQYAKEAGAIISFDPNVRKQLWEKEEDLKQAIDTFIPYADIIKISDEELFFITGEDCPEEAAKYLLDKGVSLILFTLGREGAVAYTKNTMAKIPANGIPAVDTTGAGDGFIGSFLYQLAAKDAEIGEIQNMTSDVLRQLLLFSDTFCGESIQKKGAIASYATKEVIEKICKEKGSIV